MKVRLASAVLVAACGLMLAGCAQHLRIGRILNDPTRYQNRMVNVRGRVVGGVNAVVVGGYRVDDGTGTIIVLSNGGVPRRGTEVKLTGRVQSGVSVFGQSFGTTIRERDRRVRY